MIILLALKTMDHFVITLDFNHGVIFLLIKTNAHQLMDKIVNHHKKDGILQ
jgi:hypothetical protein